MKNVQKKILRDFVARNINFEYIDTISERFDVRLQQHEDKLPVDDEELYKDY